MRGVPDIPIAVPLNLYVSLLGYTNYSNPGVYVSSILHASMYGITSIFYFFKIINEGRSPDIPIAVPLNLYVSLLGYTNYSKLFIAGLY